MLFNYVKEPGKVIVVVTVDVVAVGGGRRTVYDGAGVLMRHA